MTLTLNLNSQAQIDEFKMYLKELYEFIDLDKENIPGSININESTCTVSIYMADDFFSYAYQFFINELVLALNNDGDEKKRLEFIAKEFRQGSEGMLVSNVLLT